MKFYIRDTTLGNTPVYYSTLGEVIKHLEGTIQRKFRKSRRDYMQNLTELGHGYDDSTGKNFVDSLYQHFDIGVVKQLRHVRCNIHEISQYSGYRTEMGD
jgi:hypothetical protein